MSDTSITAAPGFDELPKAEQVRYLQVLWDQISERPDENQSERKVTSHDAAQPS